jgi:hypothetical protein
MISGTLGQSPTVLIGAFAQLARQFTAADVLAFATLSGDHNPIHLDEAFAKTTPFGRCIVHGMLGSSLFSTMFATRIPGCIYISQSLAFKAPVFVGDSVLAKCVRACLILEPFVCAAPCFLLTTCARLNCAHSLHCDLCEDMNGVYMLAGWKYLRSSSAGCSAQHRCGMKARSGLLWTARLWSCSQKHDILSKHFFFCNNVNARTVWMCGEGDEAAAGRKRKAAQTMRAQRWCSSFSHPTVFNNYTHSSVVLITVFFVQPGSL